MMLKSKIGKIYRLKIILPHPKDTNRDTNLQLVTSVKPVLANQVNQPIY